MGGTGAWGSYGSEGGPLKGAWALPAWLWFSEPSFCTWGGCGWEKTAASQEQGRESVDTPTLSKSPQGLLGPKGLHPKSPGCLGLVHTGPGSWRGWVPTSLWGQGGWFWQHSQGSPPSSSPHPHSFPGLSVWGGGDSGLGATLRETQFGRRLPSRGASDSSPEG